MPSTIYSSKTLIPEVSLPTKNQNSSPLLSKSTEPFLLKKCDITISFHKDEAIPSKSMKEGYEVMAENKVEFSIED